VYIVSEELLLIVDDAADDAADEVVSPAFPVWPVDAMP
jgi:hypothetical protein